jgi:peptidyl-prolyl cis-trans isomerase C
LNSRSKLVGVLGLVAMVTVAGLVVAQNPPAGPAPAGPAAAAPAATPATATTKATDPNKVVLQVGTEKLTAKQFEDFIADLGPQAQAAMQGPAKREIVNQLVDAKLLAQEAQKRGLDKDPKFQRRVDMVKEQLLAQSLVENVQQGGGNDEKLKQQYEANKSQYETATARHILIRSKDSPVPLGPGKKDLSDAEAKAKAEDVRKRIVGGEDFATVAKAESDDTGSGAQGGTLGTFGHGQMVKPFEDAAFGMKPGEISQPVKTQFGYHVIQLQDKKVQPFEDVKAELAGKQGGEQLDALLKDLRKSGTVNVDDAYFGPAQPRPQMPLGLPPQ